MRLKWGEKNGQEKSSSWGGSNSSAGPSGGKISGRNSSAGPSGGKISGSNSSAVPSGGKSSGNLSQPKVEESTSSSQVPCPICNKKVDQKQINEHVDICLLGPPPPPDNKSAGFDDPFDDDDDVPLVSINGGKRDSESDHSDDEPLIKRRPGMIADLPDDDVVFGKPFNGQSQADEDMFNDQDDRDILAALGDDIDQDSSMFACPVCEKMLVHALMHKHLDACLIG